MQLLQPTVKQLSRVGKFMRCLGVLIAVSLTFANRGFSQETAVPAVDEQPAAPRVESPAVDVDQNAGVPGLGGFGTGGAGGFGGARGFGGSSMGIPISAIPGRKWVAGDGVIVAISDDGKKVSAYSEQHPRWASHDLVPVPGCAAIPIIGGSAAVRLGHYVYAYSPTLGTWDVLKLPEGEAAIPIVGDDSVNIHSASRGDYVFKSAWGKWFSAEEIKAGRVAEYLLAQRDTKAAGKPLLGKVMVFPLKFADATNAARIIQQLLDRDGRNIWLAADARTNSLLINADQELVREVEGLVKILDVPGKDAKLDTQLEWPDGGASRSGTTPDAGGGSGAMPKDSRSGGVSVRFDFGAAQENIADVRDNSNRLEQRTRELAASLRGPAPAQGAARKVIEDQLREIVPQAFAARQKLQRAELAKFARRLQGIQQSIEMRDRIAQQIIDRRVEELLEPNLKWDSAESPPAVDPDRSDQVGPRQVSAVTGANSDPILGEGEIQLIANHKHGHLEWLTKPGNWTLIGTDSRVVAPFGSQLKLRLSGLPDRGDAIVFIAVEIPEADATAADVLLHNPVPLSLASGSLLDPLFNEKQLTRVLYLPHDSSTASGSLYLSVSSSSLAPGVNPLTEAKKLGIVVAVMRFSLDVQSGTTPLVPGVDGEAQLPARVLDSPQVVLQLMYDYGERQDYASYISLFTDEEVNRLAGMLLRSAAVIDAMSKLSAKSAEQAVPLEPVYQSRIATVVERFSKEDPPAAALNAFWGDVLDAFSQTVRLVPGNAEQTISRPARTAEDYSTQLRLAAGILSDPRKFCAEMMHAMSALNPSQKSDSKMPQWQIEINDDEAVATSDLEASEPTGKMNPSVVQLRRIDGQWRISSFISDEQILEFTKGPGVTEAKSFNPDEKPGNSEPIVPEPDRRP